MNKKQEIFSNYVNPHSSGIHYESMDEFHESFYKEVYRNAFVLLQDIIRQNSAQNISYLYGEKMLRNSGSHTVSYEKFSNILTFIGGRGTGKTSVMLSFMEALRNYNADSRMINMESLFFRFKQGKDKQDILFTCLDCIDGSLLEHGEDIFKIVLAQMYQKFVDMEGQDEIYKNDDFDYRRRGLLKGLEDIYKTVCDIEGMEEGQRLSGVSYMTNLQSLSSSQKVKKDFEKLISKFTDLMKYKGYNRTAGEEHYVVITIDDIDLNVKNGFSMLEKIHRYCMVPNVIVLLSVDMEQILSIVFQNFFEIVPKVDSIMCREEERIQKLSMDYLDKVIPVNHRVYLPEITDYYSSRSLAIKKENGYIKNAIFGKLYRRSGICFDTQGMKRHFYEPKSMRQLTNFYLLMESMDSVDLEIIYGKQQTKKTAEREAAMQRWEDNYRILMADLSKRMVLEKIYLDKDAYDLYEAVRKEDINRAKDRIVGFYQKCFNKEERQKNRIENIENECSYGELVEAIYYLGRLEGAKYKPLVHCLLAYLSYAFTRVYIFERLEHTSDQGKVSVGKNRMQDLVGRGLVENWTSGLIPTLPLHNEENMGIEEDSNVNSKKQTAISYANFEDVALSSVFKMELQDPKNFSETKRYIYAAKMIRNIEMLILLFYRIRENEDALKVLGIGDLEFKMELGIYGTWELKLKEISYVGEFNIFNIVMNSMYAVDGLIKVEEKLIDLFIKNYLFKDKVIDNNMELEFEKTLEKYSLASKYKEWEGKVGKASLPIPVYWFDLTYNILKRTWKALKEKNPALIQRNELFFYIKKLYDSIGKQLEKQQHVYESGAKNIYANRGKNPNRYSYKLYDIFKECPAIDYFLAEEDDKEANDGMENKENFMNEIMDRVRQFSREV